MNISFSKVSLGGNDTIIVRTPVRPDDRASISRTLMSRDFVGGEHVAFLSRSTLAGVDTRLDMMGGEFCVNALRAAATVLASERGEEIIRLSSSGMDQPVICRVKANCGFSFTTSISFNMTPVISNLQRGVSIVQLEGIAHVLIEYGADEVIGDVMSIFKDYSRKLTPQLLAFPAYGIIPFQSWNDGYRMFPAVFVRETNSVVLETACGSGSVALAFRFTSPTGTSALNIYQPSGSRYQVVVTGAGDEFTVSLESEARILLSGVAYLDCS